MTYSKFKGVAGTIAFVTILLLEAGWILRGHPWLESLGASQRIVGIGFILGFVGIATVIWAARFLLVKFTEDMFD